MIDQLANGGQRTSAYVKWLGHERIDRWSVSNLYLARPGIISSLCENSFTLIMKIILFCQNKLTRGGN